MTSTDETFGRVCSVIAAELGCLESDLSATTTADDVDGKFIKSADHGMGIALNLLFDRYYPTIERRDGVTDRELETALTFDGPKYSYRIAHHSSGMRLAATCEARSPISGETVDRPAG